MKGYWLTGLLFLSISHSLMAAERLIALSPHLTELVFELGQGHRLVAVSDHSDYPEQAKALPRVASYQGVDFEQVMALKPDLILVWQGGNKPQDIARLKSMGFELFISQPRKPLDIADDIEALGQRLNVAQQAHTLASSFRQRLQQIRKHYHRSQPLPVFYYMWPSPLMTVGGGAWANHLLDYCGAGNIFADAPTDYPEVPMESVIERQPQRIIAANHKPKKQTLSFWRPWLEALPLGPAQILQMDPDPLHRFSLRLAPALQQLCQQIDTNNPALKR
ncbi:Vitamin B12-binding protein [Saliniradius amylolyticus]|uniref:Vitamin B12-binding protein n=1 Tax=Saliniradius amylolyticus TaxID=2183582 RepID=A0A2S2E5S1_9ALTE|nr:cobalamin-binding protein [Saliniradius amylolyticus]AWL12983.1 Vitamin B12-binding protein [Saliniradius amylolyticus]